jgi:hypothetical protein
VKIAVPAKGSVALPPMDALGWHPAKTVFSSGIVV